ncbi:hypothetical protein Ahy_B01g054469 [Arachis hypogaea]|uniref:Uncharacterized protein n=1 Tax=Arachis hypogaea TaxID=3818 RepID=A0A445ATW9_ARAHY|nr:hypothetical protein Ahy_B01g054469 [Arachis hypogaea]
MHADPYSLVGSSSDTTAPTNRRPPPIATTIPSRQEPQIHMMPTPGVPRSCTQQANEPSNTASHGVQSDPAIVAPSRAGSCGKIQTTSNSTQDAQGQGTSTATGHSSTSAPKLRYDGAKCCHPPKPRLKRISQVFRKNYNKSWLSFDEADDDTRKIWWTEAAKRLRGMLHAIHKKGARPYWIPPEVLGELMRRWNTDAYRQLQARNTIARKSTRGTFLHTAGGTTFPEARLRLDIFQERMFQAKQERNSQMDQFSHQLSSLTEYVRAMGPSSSGSRVPPPPPFTFPSSQKSTAPALVPTPASGVGLFVVDLFFFMNVVLRILVTIVFLVLLLVAFTSLSLKLGCCVLVGVSSSSRAS